MRPPRKVNNTTYRVALSKDAAQRVVVVVGRSSEATSKEPSRGPDVEIFQEFPDANDLWGAIVLHWLAVKVWGGGDGGGGGVKPP